MDKNKITLMATTAIFTLALAVMVFSFLQFSGGKSSITQIAGSSVIDTPQQNVQSTQTQNTQSIDILPKGVPEIYGKELSVSYDDISVNDQQKADAVLKKIGALDTQIKLSGEEQQRYIKVGTQISCEYCCGVETIIFENGQAACGCAHSFAMRGIAKYILKYHGKEYTDDQILEELGKWKALFFPSKMAAKAQVLKDKGIELNYINLGSNKYRGIENKK